MMDRMTNKKIGNNDYIRKEDRDQDSLSLFQYFLSLIIFGIILTGFAIATQSILADNIKKQQELNKIKASSQTILNLLEIYEQISNKGSANGYVPLNIDGKIPDNNLSPESIVQTKYFGCWEPDINAPTLISGIGEQFFTYIVCTTGMTMLNGISDWMPFDIVYYIGEQFGWFKFYGRQNKLENTGKISTEGPFSFIQDGIGPLMSLKSISTTDPNLSIFQTSTNLEIRYSEPEGTSIQLLDAGSDPLGFSLILTENSSNSQNSAVLKNLRAINQINVREGDSTNPNLLIGASVPGKNIKSKIFPLTVAVSARRPDNSAFTTVNQYEFGAIDVGGWVRISSIESVTFRAASDGSDTLGLTLQIFLGDPSNDPFILSRLPGSSSSNFFTIMVVGYPSNLPFSSAFGNPLLVGHRNIRSSVVSELILVDLYRNLSPEFGAGVDWTFCIDMFYQYT